MKHLLSAVIRSFAVFFAGTMLCLSTTGRAAADVRTISLYHVHTHESLTVTYKKDGRYIPSAMAQINYLLRDWRKNRPTTMSPETIDLMWEMHEDLGSKQPIRIICGFRSAETNAMLKRIGRNVARQSQHITGKAIDMYFPDVPLETVRRQRARPPAGRRRLLPGRRRRLHRTSIRAMSGTGRASARPSLPRSMAKCPLHRRARQAYAVELPIATAAPNFTPAPQGVAASKVPAADEGDDDANGARFADLREQDFENYTPAPKAVAKVRHPGGATHSAAASQAHRGADAGRRHMQIEPASAPVEKPNFAERPVTMQESLGPVNADQHLVGERDLTSNIAAKGSFAMELVSATSKDAPMIRPLAEGATGVTWQASLMTASRLVRRDGQPQPFGGSESPAQLTEASLAPPVHVIQNARAERHGRCSGE